MIKIGKCAVKQCFRGHKTIKMSNFPIVRLIMTDKEVKIPSEALPNATEACGPILEEEEDEMEDMFVEGPAGIEWGGPTRGGSRPEPTRFGDWERKGRASDF